MTTDTSTSWCVSFSAAQMAVIRQQAAAHQVTVEDFIRALVQRALETERVERSEGAQMAGERATEAVKRRRG